METYTSCLALVLLLVVSPASGHRTLHIQGQPPWRVGGGEHFTGGRSGTQNGGGGIFYPARSMSTAVQGPALKIFAAPATSQTEEVEEEVTPEVNQTSPAGQSGIEAEQQTGITEHQSHIHPGSGGNPAAHGHGKPSYSGTYFGYGGTYKGFGGHHPFIGGLPFIFYPGLGQSHHHHHHPHGHHVSPAAGMVRPCGAFAVCYHDMQCMAHQHCAPCPNQPKCAHYCAPDLPDNHQCARHAQCLSGYCNPHQGVCQPQPGVCHGFFECSSDASCSAERHCSLPDTKPCCGKSCLTKYPHNYPCDRDRQCQCGYCDPQQKLCTVRPAEPCAGLVSCDDDADCMFYQHCGSSASMPNCGDHCVIDLPNNRTCDRNGQCQSGFCDTGMQQCQPVPVHCQGFQECKDDSVCSYADFCGLSLSQPSCGSECQPRYPDKTPCDRDRQCRSEYCDPESYTCMPPPDPCEEFISCSSDQVCVSEEHCSTSAFLPDCGKECQPRYSDKTPCDRDRQCRSEYCDPESYTCMPPPDPCEEFISCSSDQVCASEKHCSTSAFLPDCGRECQPRYPDKTPCDRDRQCRSDYCDPESYTCMPPPDPCEEFISCSSDQVCASEEHCSTSAFLPDCGKECQPRYPDKTPCDRDRQCQSEYCDPESYTCMPPPDPCEEFIFCSSDQVCASEEHCSTSAFLPDCGRECQPRYPDKTPCDRDRQCRSEYCDPESYTCMPPPDPCEEFISCSLDQVCASEEHCSTSAFLPDCGKECQPRYPDKTPCDRDRQCRSDYCDPESYTCMPPPDPCEEFISCSSDQVCVSEEHCSTSAFLPDCGRECQPRYPDKTPCDRDRQCRSDYCDPESYTCMPPPDPCEEFISCSSDQVCASEEHCSTSAFLPDCGKECQPRYPDKTPCDRDRQCQSEYCDPESYTCMPPPDPCEEFIFCSSDQVCASEEHCSTSAFLPDCGRECQPRYPDKTPCDRDRQCRSEYCDPESYTCMPPPDPCEEFISCSLDQVCASEEHCSTSAFLPDCGKECQPRYPDKTPCDRDRQCRSEYCDPESYTCMPPPDPCEEFISCSSDQVCASEEHCSTSAFLPDCGRECQPRYPDKTPCDRDRQCQSEYCDPESYTCMPPPDPCEEFISCSSDQVCASEKHCSTSAFLPDCGRECQPRYPDKTPCDRDRQCQSDYCDPESYTCMPPPDPCEEFSVCVSDDSCFENSHCSTSPVLPECGTECLPKYPDGTSCDRPRQCQSDYCHPENGVCAPDPCRNFITCTGDFSCKQEEHCAVSPDLPSCGKQCLPDQEIGSSCSTTDQCASGYCEPTSRTCQERTEKPKPCCQFGFTQRGNVCYEVQFRLPRDFYTARAVCRRLYGGDLSSVQDGPTNAFILGLVRKSRVRSAWIGISDEFNEGVFQQVDSGSPLKFTAAWGFRAPHTGAAGQSRDCVAMAGRFYSAGGVRFTTGEWNDESCSTERPYVCQGPVLPICNKLPEESSNTLP